MHSKDHDDQPRLQYQLPAIVKGERKTFHDTNNLKKITSHRPNLKKTQEAVFWAEERNDYNQEGVERKKWNYNY